VGVAWQLVSLMFVFIVLTRRHNVSNGELPPLILIPAVGVATVATVGGLISGYAYQISARLAVPVIITSFWFVGMGIFMALILYTFLLHQLLTKGFPPSQMTASMFVLVGPMGQSAAALQVLGSAASTDGRFAA
jgi:tellurite resistance protein TehA-like permease